MKSPIITFEKEEEDEDQRPISASSSVKQLKITMGEINKENIELKKLLADSKTELSEVRKKKDTLEKKMDSLGNFVKRIGSNDHMLKGSTSFFKKENQNLKNKVVVTNKTLSDIKKLNEDLVRTHELDRRAIEELSATISDLEFRIRMGVVSDEYTSEICQLTHQLDDDTDKHCNNCPALQLQLSKNAISLQCLVARLKQMEQDNFQLKQDKMSLEGTVQSLTEKLEESTFPY